MDNKEKNLSDILEELLWVEWVKVSSDTKKVEPIYQEIKENKNRELEEIKNKQKQHDSQLKLFQWLSIWILIVLIISVISWLYWTYIQYWRIYEDIIWKYNEKIIELENLINFNKELEKQLDKKQQIFEQQIEIKQENFEKQMELKINNEILKYEINRIK